MVSKKHRGRFSGGVRRIAGAVDEKPGLRELAENATLTCHRGRMLRTLPLQLLGVPEVVDRRGRAAWHRKHAENPRYRPGAVIDDSRPRMARHRWTGWSADGRR